MLQALLQPSGYEHHGSQLLVHYECGLHLSTRTSTRPRRMLLLLFAVLRSVTQQHNFCT